MKKRKNPEKLELSVFFFLQEVNIGDMEGILDLEPTNQKGTEGNWNFPFTYS